MKFATLIALTATTSAKHIIDGATAEDVQDQLLEAGEDAAEFWDNDMGPNFDQAMGEQIVEDQAYQQRSEQIWNDFVARGDAANYDVKLDAIGQQIDAALRDLETNAHANGFARRRAASTKLWSVGMTAQKTAAVNQKLIKVAADAETFYADPVYGPFIQQHQQVLFTDLEAAFTKYMTAMETKYNTDPVFRAKADASNALDMELGAEIEDPTGWTFEDTDGALEQAANQWH